MPGAAIYCRISSDRTGEQAGVKRQEQTCRSIAADKGIDVVDVYVDNDKSAYKHRPDFERMMGDIAAGRVTSLISYNGDRVARRPKDLERLLDLVEAGHLSGGVHYHLAGSVDMTTPQGRAVGRTLVAWAHAEVETMVERRKEAYRQAAEEGRPHGGSQPIGYNEDRVTVHPIEGPLIAESVERVLNGESLRSICERWRPVRKIGHSALHRVLVSPRIAGIRHYTSDDGTVIVTPDTYEAIIDADTHARVSAVLGDPARRTGGAHGRAGFKRWLTGVIFCANCDVKMSATSAGKRGVARYKCKNDECERPVSISDRLMHDYVENLILPVLHDPRLRDRMGDDDHTDELAALDAAIAGVDASMGELEDEVVAGRTTVAQMARLNVKLVARQRDLYDQRDGFLRAPQHAIDVTADDWQDLDAHGKRDVARAIFERIDVVSGRQGGSGHTAAERCDVVWRTA